MKTIARILRDEFNSDVPKPDEVDLLIEKCPGIGPKMAFITMNVAYPESLPNGIGVDTHVFRIANKIKFANAKSPEKVRQQLQSWLPRELWKEVNLLMVGLGQQIQQKAEHVKIRAVLEEIKHEIPGGKDNHNKTLELLKLLGLKIQ